MAADPAWRIPMIRPLLPRTCAAWIAAVASIWIAAYAHAANENWTQIVTPSGPDAVADLSGAFDPISSRMIVFGGQTPLAQTWALTPWGTPHWDPLITALSPQPRHGASMVYDPV